MLKITQLARSAGKEDRNAVKKDTSYSQDQDIIIIVALPNLFVPITKVEPNIGLSIESGTL